MGRVVGGLLNDVGDVTNLEGKLGQTERRKRKLQRSSTLRLSPSIYPFPIFLSSVEIRSTFVPSDHALEEKKRKKRERERKRKGREMRVKRVSARYRGKITRSLNELWYFVGMTLEPMDLDQRRVVNGVACSMTSRGCRVKPLQLGHSLILSWP